MLDEKNFPQKFSELLENIRKNKFRTGGLIALIIFSVAVKFIDLADDEKIILDESPKVSEKISSDEKIIPVQGGSSEEIYVADPFLKNISEEEPEEKTPALPEEEKILPPDEKILLPEKSEEPLPPQKNFILVGTAVSSENKIALVQSVTLGKNSSHEDLLLGVGDFLGERQIIDIAEKFLILEDGEKIYISNEK